MKLRPANAALGTLQIIFFVVPGVIVDFIKKVIFLKDTKIDLAVKYQPLFV